MGSSTVQLHGVPDRYANSKLVIKLIFILHKTHVTGQFQWKPYNIRLQLRFGKMYFYMI